VGPVVPGEGETSTQVLGHGGLHSLEGSHELVIDLLLSGGAIGRHCLLLVFVEYVSALGLGGFVLEESIVDSVGFEALDGDFGAGDDGVSLVHALEGHAVHLEGAGHEHQTGLELLEEDNSVTAVLAGGEDENGALLDTLAESCFILLLRAN